MIQGREGRGFRAALAAVLLTSCFVAPMTWAGGTAEQQSTTGGGSPAAAPTARWTFEPGFKTFGLKLRNEIPRDAAGPVEIAFTMSQDVQLAAFVSDAQAAKTIDGVVKEFSEPGSWSADLLFPASGSYQVAVFGKLRSTPGDTYELVARTVVNVKLDASSNWSWFPGAKTYGVAMPSAAPEAAAESLEVAFSTGQRVDVAPVIWDGNGRRLTGISTVQSDGSAHKVVFALPATDHYSVIIAVKPRGAGPEAWEAVAHGTFTATVTVALPGAPANWTATSAYKKYDVSVLSSTGRQAPGEAAIELTSSQDLAWSSSLTVAGGSVPDADLAAAVISEQAGSAHRWYIAFPARGAYELKIWVKGKADTSSTLLATAAFDAEAAPALALPANWTAKPSLWRYGGAVAAAPAENVGDQVSFAVTLARPPSSFTASAFLYDPAAKKAVGTARADVKVNEIRVNAVFPAGGAYTLRLSISEKVGDTVAFHDLAEGRLTATVDPSLPRWRLWWNGETWPRLPVSQVKAVSQAWVPLGLYSDRDSYSTGTLTADLAIATADGPVTFRKGTVLSFSPGWFGGENEIAQVSGTLAKDLVVTALGQKITLKAGTTAAVSADETSGLLPADAKFTIDGAVVTVPRGGRIVLGGGTLEELVPAAKGTVSAAGKVIEFSGILLVEPSEDPSQPSSLRFQATKDTAFKLAGASFTAPAGSILTYRKQALVRVIFPRDTVTTLPSGPETVAAGWGYAFDEKGNVLETVQAE